MQQRRPGWSLWWSFVWGGKNRNFVDDESAFEAIHKLRPANACPKHASLPLPGVEAVRGLPCPECYLELEGYPTEVDDLLEEKVEMPQCLVGAERYVIMAGMWELGAGYGWSLVWARVKDIEAAK